MWTWIIGSNDKMWTPLESQVGVPSLVYAPYSGRVHPAWHEKNDIFWMFVRGGLWRFEAVK
jgi:hypothetical protein